MSAGAAGAAAAAAAIAQAIKASGVLVRVEPAQFEAIVGRTRAPLVVTATGGLFTTNYQYLTAKRDSRFSRSPLRLITSPAPRSWLGARANRSGLDLLGTRSDFARADLTRLARRSGLALFATGSGFAA
jgi:hypothetical protein